MRSPDSKINRKSHPCHGSVFGGKVITALLLTIPLVAMQFSDEVNWTLGDFALMAGLLIACGTSYVFLRRFAKSRAARLAVALLVLACFVLIWAELAVGLLV